MDCWRELEGKRLHDPLFSNPRAVTGPQRVWIPVPIIVGAGPSGLAVAACLKDKGISSLVLERSHCIASLWQLKTYDRLRLHLPKKFCELPLMPFPDSFPNYPSKQQFIAYLEDYAHRFGIRPVYGASVESAEYDQGLGAWRVCASTAASKVEYVCRWLVVATGENADAVVPRIDAMGEFKGAVVHTSHYKSGHAYREKKVLVVGCGNSGMEVCLDLCNHNARPSIVVRDTVHVLPREMLGGSTFGLSMWLLKWLPIQMVDRLLLFISGLFLGDTAPLGLVRPQIGPLALKSISGKTPVLDVGTITKIRSGDIQVCPGIKRLTEHGAEFVSGRLENFDAIVLATGYKSNVSSWLKEREFFSDRDGLPRNPFPDGWKGERGLYAVGFTKRGLLGASMDAKRIAHDIQHLRKAEATQLMHFSCPPLLS